LDWFNLVLQYGLQTAQTYWASGNINPVKNAGLIVNGRFISNGVLIIYNLILVLASLRCLIYVDWWNSIVFAGFCWLSLGSSVFGIYALRKDLSGIYWFFCLVSLPLEGLFIYSFFTNYHLDFTNMLNPWGTVTLVALLVGWIIVFTASLGYKYLDYVSVDNLMAPVVYIGWFKVLKGIRQFSEKHEGEFFDVNRFYPRVHCVMNHRGRRVIIRCFRVKPGFDHNKMYSFIQIITESPLLFWQFSSHPMFSGKWIFKRKNGYRVGVSAPNKEQTSADRFNEKMMPVIFGGNDFLIKDSLVFSENHVLVFQTMTKLHFDPVFENIEGMVDWVTRMASNMELMGFVFEPETEPDEDEEVFPDEDDQPLED